MLKFWKAIFYDISFFDLRCYRYALSQYIKSLKDKSGTQHKISQLEEVAMAGKPTCEALEQRVKALEIEIAERDQEKEALRKANQQFKPEIEEHAVTEQALKDSQRLLQTVTDTIEGGVFAKDTNGKYLFVNKAFGKDFGVAPNDVIGKDDYFVFPPEGAAQLQENDKRIMAAKKAENIEESGMYKGRHITYLTNKVPLIDDKGNVFGIWKNASRSVPSISRSIFFSSS
jgi:PAS domain S-box-containing protein